MCHAGKEVFVVKHVERLGSRFKSPVPSVSSGRCAGPVYFKLLKCYGESILKEFALILISILQNNVSILCFLLSSSTSTQIIRGYEVEKNTIQVVVCSSAMLTVSQENFCNTIGYWPISSMQVLLVHYFTKKTLPYITGDLE